MVVGTCSILDSITYCHNSYSYYCTFRKGLEMIMILALVFLFGALVCYASCCAVARADRMSEEYYLLKEQEKRSENLKNSEKSDII